MNLSRLIAPVVTACLCGTSLAQGTGKLEQALSAYDTAITADPTEAAARLTEPVTIDGTAGVPFDFGPATFGDTTIEFILAGDPSTVPSAYLAVGENTASSLRYAQYSNTERMGFTQGGVADYQFTPGVPSPTTPTHVAYVWNTFDFTMSLYVNGALAGTAISVTPDFLMPSGAGFLGSTASGDAEVMTGTIYRVTVYPGVLPDTQIQSHAEAFAEIALPNINEFTATPAEIDSPGSAVLSWDVANADLVLLNGVPVTGTNQTVSPLVTTAYTLLVSNEVSTASQTVRLFVNPRLDLYDAAVAESSDEFPPVAILTNAVTLTGAAGEPFDFGATSGDVTMEFLLEGDPTVGPNGYLAVGEIPASSLRYAQWQNTRALGFTQAGVADYLFAPPVPSPTIATHVVYVWDADALTMKVYVNGVLAGTIANVSPEFMMPTGLGFLGANAAGAEAMLGRIHRLAVYQGELPETTIQAHATAFTSVLRPPLITAFTGTPEEILGQGSAELRWQVQDASTLYLNGVDVTGTTNQTVTPTATTTYTLVASNNVSTVSAQVRILVTPVLDNYDAVIAAGSTNELTPVISILTNIVTLTGSGGVPFDFGGTFGDVTMEFILEGDPTVAPNGYLAVGEIPTSNLRYAQWEHTRQMGFTQLGVADYLFTPEVPSPTVPTHVVYLWNTTDLSMTLYTNGVLAGTVTAVTPDFAMPSGAGFLGANPAGGEAMIGRIFRLAAYNGLLSEQTIQEHAAAFTGGTASPDAPSLAIVLAGAQPAITLTGVPGTHYRVEYRDSFAATDAWQLLQDIPSLGGTTVEVIDPTATTGRTQRYYRAVTAP